MPSFYALITTIDVPQGPPGWDTFPKPQPPGYGPGRPTHPIYNPAYPDQGLPQPQPPWGAHPSHPIYNPAYPDQGLPMPQPPGGGRPTHPIYNPAYPDNTLPQPPLGIWGGGNVPMPTPPIYFPPPGGQPPLGIWGPTDPRPSHPIAGVPPGGTPGQPPYPSQGPGFPTHPIVLPPGLPAEIPDLGPVEWKTGWTQETGWIIVGVPNEGTLTPTPS